MDSPARKLQQQIDALEEELAAVFDLSATSDEKRIELRERLRKLKEKLTDVT